MNTDLKTIAKAIIHWGINRNIIGGATAQRQFFKLMSEFGELGDAIAKNDRDGIKDGIGDTFVVLMILSGITDSQDSVLKYCEDYDFKVGGESPFEDVEHEYIVAADKIAYLGITLWDTKYISSSIKRCIAHLAIIAMRFDMTMEECSMYAYNEIKDRKGVLFNGTFIKSTDSRYEDAMAQIEAARNAQV